MISDWRQSEFGAPEEYFSALSFSAKTEWLLSGSEQPRWSISQAVFGETTFWMCNTASGHIISGSSDSTAWRIGVNLNGAHSVRANGVLVPRVGAYVIAPSADFCFACCGPHEVCKISIPEHVSQRISSQLIERQSGVLTLTQDVNRRLNALLYPDASRAPSPRENEVEELALDILGCPRKSEAGGGRHRQDRTALFILAKNAIREAPAMNPPIAALAEASGVSERTVRNVFQDCIELSPQEYIRLYRLHECRRRLVQGNHAPVIKEIAASLGFTDFGRFAGYYQEVFLELPSETLQRRGVR